ncbi:fatty acid desaturase [Emcibacter sp.]|uniref:fatty acid desaturase family protein n=1 Tax=Emcibacter sp. TaxID=1979954 RepID=UPI002AA718BD|nr:fatty acid desaturase [Emcibacter sp.]
MSGIKRAKDFPLGEARALVKDLMTPNPGVYWPDFLLSAFLGWAALAAAVMQPYGSWQFAVAFVVSSLALYRAAIFTHEIVHLKRGTFILFRIVWNLIAGFPLLIPSFTYMGVHSDHHKPNIYGTKEDGEYLPFGAQAPWKNVAYVLLSFLLPALFLVRFLILTPVSWLVPPLGRKLWEGMSSLTIDLSYKRPKPTKMDGEHWRLQEVCTSIYAITAMVLMATGIMPWKVLAVWYGVTSVIFLMNSFRTLGAHAYRNPGDETLTVAEQFLDSVDVPGGVISALWAPVGLRFHATHHLFPQMPYHSLGTAYQRLASDPEIGPHFLEASRPTLWHALKTLWADAAASQKS